MSQFFSWLLARLWKNFGVVLSDQLYRSGQFGPIRLRLMYWLMKPDVVLAMNIRPDQRRGPEAAEINFFRTKPVLHLCYDFSSTGIMKEEDLERFRHFVSVAQSSICSKKKVWIHCAGGKDRTGGLVGFLLMNSMIPTTNSNEQEPKDRIQKFIEECFFHKIPYDGWLHVVFGIVK